MEKCKAKTYVMSRIVGYYSPVHVWNLGKKSEFEARKTFKVIDNYPPKVVEEIKAMLQGAAT